VTRTPTPLARESPLTKLLAVLLLIVAGALVFTVVQFRRAGVPGIPFEPRPISLRPDDKLGADEQGTIDVFSKFSRSVVHITSLATRTDRMTMDVSEIPQGTGSGIIWDQNGHIVTNFHVVSMGDRATVTLNDGTSYPATIVGTAPDKDLAVLHIDAPPQKLLPLPIGQSAGLKVGQKVLAIGNPFGLDQTLTTGVISGLNREIKSVTNRPISDVIQTDASINPGNSGGPLLDSAGRLIGINTAIFSPSGANAGIGFAVPVDTVNSIVPQLLEHGHLIRPGLGISNIASDQLAQKLGLDGVLVLQVAPDGAAAHAGITPTAGSSAT
jgi:S1-C subfamily serine protease